MGRSESGFTLVEMLVVLVAMTILTAIAFGFSRGARERADDVTAQANLRAAVPAIEAYRADTGGYADMTIALLQASSPGVDGLSVVSADNATYCVSTVVNGSTWYKAGPSSEITTTACS